MALIEEPPFSFNMQIGDPVESFHKIGNAHLRSTKTGNFNFSGCKRADDELGSFDFNTGREKTAFFGHGPETSAPAIHGVEAFFELSDAAKALCLNANSEEGLGIFYTTIVNEAENMYDANIFPQEDESRQEWMSPRISFSQDFATGELEASCSSGILPQPADRPGENGEGQNGYSSEFEFLSTAVLHDGLALDCKDVMLSAEQLFSDGKLLPMHTQEKALPKPAADHGMDLGEVRSVSVRPQTAEFYSENSEDRPLYANGRSSEASHQKRTARQLSMDLPRPVMSSTICRLTPLVSASVDNSPCSSPPRSLNPPPKVPALTSHVTQKASSKYSLRNLFKAKRMSHSSGPQLTREDSITSASSCRIPIPPRTFWPFSRSNSAGESKTSTPPLPSLPPRSNSAGESNISRVATALKNSDEVGILKLNERKFQGQETSLSAGKDELDSAKAPLDAHLVENCIDVEISRQYAGGSEKYSNNAEEECVSDKFSQKSIVCLNKGKASGSPGRTGRKRYMYSTSKFPRGSPGRRGGNMNSVVKLNTNKNVLKNLERCSADRKLCRETSGRRAVAYPVALRVSPVLNVALYRGGKVPSSGMFGLRGLFSSKKKAKDKEAVMNNWRAGA